MTKLQKKDVYHAFESVEEFQDFLRSSDYPVCHSGGCLDYMYVGDILYTMHEYDMRGRSITWGNKKHAKMIELTTFNRYENGYEDAEVEEYDAGYMRNDIAYAEQLMKLYATVIGEKAGKYVEKGQGSNQSLAIEILAEGLKGIPTRANIYRLSLNIGNDNELQADMLDYSTGETMELIKGNKQKGEKRCPMGHEEGYCSDNCAGMSVV